MRVPRAYLAGFGTSGSLLAGAALLFVLASAFIGFDGWPQVADSPSTVAVALPHAALGTSTAGRVLVNAPNRAVGTSGGGAAGTARSAGATPSARARLQGGSTPGGGVLHPGASSSGPSGTPSGPPAANCPSSGCGQPPPNPPKPQPSGPVNHAVQGVTKTVGPVVGTVKKILPINLPPGGSPTSTAHHTVSGAASTARHLLP